VLVQTVIEVCDDERTLELVEPPEKGCRVRATRESDDDRLGRSAGQLGKGCCENAEQLSSSWRSRWWR
jgi:hypothetical protein